MLIPSTQTRMGGFLLTSRTAEMRLEPCDILPEELRSGCRFPGARCGEDEIGGLSGP